MKTRRYARGGAWKRGCGEREECSRRVERKVDTGEGEELLIQRKSGEKG